jgi:hypothetical protein
MLFISVIGNAEVFGWKWIDQMPVVSVGED